MKLKISHLFYIMTTTSVLLLIWDRLQKRSAPINDFHNMGGYTYFLSTVIILSYITALLYSLLDKKDKPIKKQTGLIHFSLIAIGLILSFNTYQVILTTCMMIPGPDTMALAPSMGDALLLFGGPILLVAGLFIFISGFIKANRTKADTH